MLHIRELRGNRQVFRLATGTGFLRWAAIVALLALVSGGTPAAAQSSATEEAATIRDVGLEPNSGSDATFSTGDTILVHVSFDQIVVVTGSPQLEINVGGEAKQATYQPSYERQNGISYVVNLSNLRFRYTIQTDDSDLDGISIGANKLSLNGATIVNNRDNTVAADLSHEAVAADRRTRVNAPTAPTPSSLQITSDPGDDKTYGTGDTIEVTVTFSEAVTVTGSPQVNIDLSGDIKNATYSSTSEGNTELVFGYVVVVGDTSSGVSIPDDAVSLNGGTISGNNNEAAVLFNEYVAPIDGSHLVSAPGGI